MMSHVSGRHWATRIGALLALALASQPVIAKADRLLDAAGRAKKSGLPLLIMVSTGAG